MTVTDVSTTCAVVIFMNLTLKMTTAQVVETSVTVNDNSPIQDYVHPDDQTQPIFIMFRVILFNALWKFLGLGNSAWKFFGDNVLSKDFSGFDFCPHSIIRVTCNPEYPPPGFPWDCSSEYQ